MSESVLNFLEEKNLPEVTKKKHGTMSRKRTPKIDKF